MPAFNTPQAGGVRTQVNPADSFVLFNNESPAVGNSSIAFARGVGEGLQPSAMVFTLTGGSSATVAIQGSNQDVDGDYVTLGTLSSTAPYYNDSGTFAFYRANMTGGTGPIFVCVQR